MKSIFHVKANTLEELRNEFVEWCSDQSRRAESEEAYAKTLREKSIASAKRVLMNESARFWREIIIDKDQSKGEPT